MRVQNIREHFRAELAAKNFTVDRSGSKTIELIGASFLADEAAIFGTVNEEYVQAEIDWYMRESTNINKIFLDGREPPAAWKMAANKQGEINSNYGKLIFSSRYGEQYVMAVNELIKNPDSRRAIMIYNRPTMHVEYKLNGKNDFICTNAVTYYIRNGKMHCVVQMRSNDVVYGYKNDYAWQKHILDDMVRVYNDLAENKVESGDIHWQVQNLHVYERHFGLVI